MAIFPERLALWSDDALLVIDKPAGLPTLPDGYDSTAPHVRSLLEPLYGRLWIVHRLDRETSGVLVLARSAQAHRAMNDAFAGRSVHKIYHALVWGQPEWSEKTLRMPLRPNGDRRHRTVLDPRRGKPAETGLKVLELYRHYALLQAEPTTGRTHQIRAHLTAIGLPLVGDGLYGPGQAIFLSQIKPGFSGGVKGECAILARTALHACTIAFPHPHSGIQLNFTAPYPKDFNGALRQLRRYALLTEYQKTDL